MISVQIISTIIGGAKLALSVAEYLDSKKPNWRTEQICAQLDAIRDVHLKAGYQFLKDAALSKSDESGKKCLELAYSKFVLASKSYPLDMTHYYKNVKISLTIDRSSLNNWVVKKIIARELKKDYGIENVNDFLDKVDYETKCFRSWMDSLEGLAMCNILLDEVHRAKDVLIELLKMQAKDFLFYYNENKARRESMSHDVLKVIQRGLSRYQSALPAVFYIKKSLSECLELGKCIVCIAPETDLHSIENYTELENLNNEVNENSTWLGYPC